MSVANTSISFPARGHTGRPKRALIISDSQNEQRARLLREGELLTSHGVEITVVGVSGNRPLPPEWSTIHCLGGILGGASALGPRAIVLNTAARWSRRAASINYWMAPSVRSMKKMLKNAPPFDLVVGHNFASLPIGVWAKNRWDAPLVMDFHEYAIGEHMERPRWSTFVRPFIKSLMEEYLPQCDAITVICEGIGDAMARDHGLEERPRVIRSTPYFTSGKLTDPTPNRLSVLYHGNVFPHRGLETVIRSVPMWREEYHLTIRGNGAEEYIQSLKKLAEDSGCLARITFEAAVPRDEVIARASESDIGLFVTEGESPQRKYVLPNKFFEYVMAGLALCVSDLPEMSRLVRAHDLGHLVTRLEPNEVAAQINAFDAAAIRRYRENSFAAAKSLNWETEREHLRAVYSNVGFPLEGSGPSVAWTS